MSEPILRRTDQTAVTVLLMLSAVVITGSFALRSCRHGGMIEIEHARDQTVDFRVDVNRATWPELALLPGIGQTLAQRIVESRERDGDFRSAGDLVRVSGIGPVTLERITPYLVFESAPDSAVPQTTDE